MPRQGQPTTAVPHHEDRTAQLRGRICARIVHKTRQNGLRRKRRGRAAMTSDRHSAEVHARLEIPRDDRDVRRMAHNPAMYGSVGLIHLVDDHGRAMTPSTTSKPMATTPLSLWKAAAECPAHGRRGTRTTRCLPCRPKTHEPEDDRLVSDDRGSCKGPPPDCRRIVIRLRYGIKGRSDRRATTTGESAWSTHT